MATISLPVNIAADKSAAGAMDLFDSYFSRLVSGQPAAWNKRTLTGLLALVVIWGAWLHGTWGGWGNVSVDSGREVYVASVLAQGKTLYQDVWFNFGPASPYFNSWLFRLFGTNLTVVYWAGALSALASALLLYVCGMRLSSPLAGWATGGALLFQSFHPTLFSFPFPYSFAAVYGCVIGCLMAWLLIRGATSQSWLWTCAAGFTAAIAMLLKFEFGGAAYLTLALLIFARVFMRRSPKASLIDLAAIVPSLIFCAVVIQHFVALQGASFLTQENFQSWPGSYFMRTYGETWLAVTGFDFSAKSLGDATLRIFIFLAFVQGLHLILTPSGQRPPRRVVFLRAALFLLAAVYFLATMSWFFQLRAVFFPQDMIVYVGVGAAATWLYFLRRKESENAAAVALLLTLATLMPFRILFKMLPLDYPIYYNGPAILSFLLLMRALIPSFGRTKRFLLITEAVLCLACFAVPAARSRDVVGELPRPDWLSTSRGSIRLSASHVLQYQAAIQFMREKSAQGETVLSVPEDTSLYFFSETECPVRVIAFTPGMLVPGKMVDETIEQIERHHVKYLIWSNRLFPEYKTLRFGIDFDQRLGNYFFSHYRRIGPISPVSVQMGEWNAFVWERIPDTTVPDGQMASQP